VNDGIARCAACGVELAPGLLACPACRKLVHARQLAALAAAAEAAEREGRTTEALGSWREALDLLPRGTKQHEAVEATVRRMSQAIDRGEGAPAAGAPPGRAGGAAGLGAVGLLLWKLKFVILAVLGKAKLLVTGLASLPTLISMVAWVALDGRRGLSFTLGLVASIYVHEMGHVAALRRYGIQATAPMFVPGFGALVRLHQYPIDAREDARVGLAGPVWGCVAAAVALALGHALHERTILAVASLGALINVFNLIPVWQLDGARGFRALDGRQRVIVAGLAMTLALALGQTVGLAVGAAAGIRLRHDVPAQGDKRAFWTFAALLVALAAIAWGAEPPAPPAG
jgi:Zn-dependent protease